GAIIAAISDGLGVVSARPTPMSHDVVPIVPWPIVPPPSSQPQKPSPQSGAAAGGWRGSTARNDVSGETTLAVVANARMAGSASDARTGSAITSPAQRRDAGASG